MLYFGLRKAEDIFKVAAETLILIWLFLSFFYLWIFQQPAFDVTFEHSLIRSRK